MLTVVLREVTVAGRDYRRGEILDTDALRPRTEALLLDQRTVRAAQADEVETQRRLEKPRRTSRRADVAATA